MPVPVADKAGRVLKCHMVDEVCLQKGRSFHCMILTAKESGGQNET